MYVTNFNQASRLTLLEPMEFSIKSGWSILYIERLQIIISENIIFLSLKIDFVYANSADPDEMPHFVAFHLGLH